LVFGGSEGRLVVQVVAPAIQLLAVEPQRIGVHLEEVERIGEEGPSRQRRG
jgi:hypothetical protein